MRRLASRLLLFLPILFAVAAVNYTVDPSLLFGNGRVEREMANIMLSGQNVANILNYDHRLLQKFYFENRDDTPDIVVLGSSRSMLVRESFFLGHTFYNASVAGGSVEDFLAIYQLMLNTGHEPKTVILDISPWVFNRNNGQTRWRSLRTEYFDALERIGVEPDWQEYVRSFDFNKYSALLSLPYLQESLRWLTREKEYYATPLEYTGEFVKQSDGSLVYGEFEENRTPAEISILAQNTSQKLPEFDELDPYLMLLFEHFVAQLKQDGVELVFYLAPYYPELYTFEKLNAPAVEAYLVTFASQNGIPVFGSFDLAKVGCSEEEFYDPVHPRPSCVDKLGLQLP